MRSRNKTKGWWEEYRCGCVSKTVRTKRELLGYCPKHGESRRRVWPEDPKQWREILVKGRGTKMKSEFENWFVNQFGTRSKRPLTDSDLREEIASAESRLFHARRELESRHIWDAWHDAALKAWCARDCKGKKKRN